VLAAVVIGILTISSLWVFVIWQADNPVNNIVVTDSDIQVLEDTKAKGFETERFENKYGIIDRKLVSLAGKIDRGFESQQTHNSEVKRDLTVMTESLQSIREAIAALGESSQALGRHISKATSRLDALVKDVRALKTVKRKSESRHKHRPVKQPPFQIDAIDIWDDLTYVAVSQVGQVAFLKSGEQQSGWTVTRIDHLTGQIDLKGPAGQVHTVSVQR
jgi:type I site-specific restriction endonuclease